MVDNQEKINERVFVTKSVTSPSKNIVEMRPGPSKNQVKCKIRKLLPTKISRLILPSEKDSSDNSLKSFHSSIANIQANNNEKSKCFIDKSGDFQDEEQELKSTILSNSTVTIDESKTAVSQDVKNQERLSTGCDQITVNESIIEPIFVKNKQIISNKDTMSSSIDDDIISSSVYSIDLQESISSSVATILQSKPEEENKDSTLHINYDNDDDFEPDDEDEDIPLKQGKRKRISTEHTMLATPKEHLVSEDEEEHSQSENEEPQSEDLEEESSTEHSRYIESGLRRLKSEESVLYLDPITYKGKRKPPTPEQTSEEIDPVLEELSSDLFEEARKSRAKREKKTRPAVEETKPAPPSPKPETKKEEESSEEDEEEETEESSEIDQTPLHKLKELEDRRFRIDAKALIPPEPEVQDVLLPGKKIPSRSKPSGVISPPEKKKKEDFCLHTKGKRDQSRKKKSRFGFLRHFDICIHTMDEDVDDIYSTSTADYSISDKQRKSSSLPKPSSVSIRQPSRSKSQGFSTVSLINNKGSRRSKLKQPSSKNWRHV